MWLIFSSQNEYLLDRWLGLVAKDRLPLYMCYMTVIIWAISVFGKTAESPTTILMQDWFKNYELKWGLGACSQS